MVPRWETMDKMLHQLGAVRQHVDLLGDASAQADPAAEAVRRALEGASLAVHRCLDEDTEKTRRGAWEAIARAQDALGKAQGLIDEVRKSRSAAREMRSRAAQQREAARRWKRAAAYGAGGPIGAPPTYDRVKDDKDEGGDDH
jgi:hypothetical protein